jgi:hypothetical protein
MQREGGEGAGYRDVEPTNKRYLEIRTGYTFTFFRELTDTAKQKLKQDWIRNNSPQIGIEPADQQEPIGLSFYLDRAGVIEDESAVHNQWIRQVEEEEEFQDKIAAARGNLKMSDLDLSKLLRGAELLRDEQFMNKLDEVCGRLQINTVDLITVMQAESLLNPTAINPQSGASGLIQFMPKTARGLGTSVEAIRNMDPIDQLDLVEQYYSRYRGRMNNYADLYLATFYPRALYRGLDFVLGSEESADRVRVIANQNRKSVLNAAGKPNQSYITKRDFLKYCQVKQRNILANLQIA